MRSLQFLTGLVVAGCVAACGGSTEPTQPASADTSLTDIDPDAEFASEIWGIGTSWYDYDSATHAVTPKAQVYAVVDTSSTTLFEVTNYYDERGESGHFTLATADETLAMESNVKEAEACVAFEPLREVSCGAEADVLLSTMRRPLPDGGFAVRSPGFWVVPREDREVYIAQAESVAQFDPARLDTAEPVPSVARDARVSRVADTSGVHVQLDGDLMLAAWTYADGTFRVRCAEGDWANEQPLSDSQVDTLKVPGEPGIYTVSLCDGVVQSAQAKIGLWPDGKYDLIAEVGDDVSFKLHPGSLHWRWSTTADIQAAATAAVWEGYAE